MKTRRLGNWHLCTLVALSVSPSGTSSNPAPQYKPTPTTTRVSKIADEFVAAWSSNDHATLKQLIGYPFRPILPCKNAPINSWDTFEGRFLGGLGLDGLGTVFKVQNVGTLAEYVKSFELKDPDAFIRTFDNGVFVAYVSEVEHPKRSFAVLVRVEANRCRVVGFGMVMPPKK